MGPGRSARRIQGLRQPGRGAGRAQGEGGPGAQAPGRPVTRTCRLIGRLIKPRLPT